MRKSGLFCFALVGALAVYVCIFAPAAMGQLVVSIDHSTPLAGQLVMGSTGNNLAVFNLADLGSNPVRVTGGNVFAHSNLPNEQASFANLTLSMAAGTVVGTAGNPVRSIATNSPGPGFFYPFNFSQGVIIPAGGSAQLVLRGDVPLVGATDDAVYTFEIAVSPDAANNTKMKALVAIDTVTNVQINPQFSSPVGNPQTVLRSTMSLFASGIGPLTSRPKSAVDQLGTVTLTANPAGLVTPITLTFGFAGSAPNGNLLNVVRLLDQNGNDLTLSGQATTTVSSPCTGIGMSTCTKAWHFSSLVIPAGASAVFTLVLDDFQGTNTSTSPNQALTLGATILSGSYADGIESSDPDSSAPIVPLPPTVLPTLVTSLQFAVGT